MSFEDEYSGRPKKKNPITPFLPVLGLFLAVSMGAIAWVLSPIVHELLIDSISDFPVEQEVQYAVAVIIFGVLILFAGLVYAAFAPKPAKTIAESELKKERVAAAQEKKAMQRRKRKMNLEMAKERERREKSR